MRIERIEKSKHKQERLLVFLEGGDLLRITGAELLRIGFAKRRFQSERHIKAPPFYVLPRGS